MKALAFVFLLASVWSCSDSGSHSEGGTTEETEETILKSQSPLEYFAINACKPMLKNESDCFCSFRDLKDQGESTIFYATPKGQACIFYEGNIVLLQGGRKDKRAEMRKNLQKESWIVIKENGLISLFDQEVKLPEDADKVRKQLAQYLLVADEMPVHLPLIIEGKVCKDETTKLQELYAEAMTLAREAYAQGNRGPALNLKFSNDDFLLLIKGKRDGYTPKGEETFEATIELTKDRGQTVLAKTQVWGNCGC